MNNFVLCYNCVSPNHSEGKLLNYVQYNRLIEQYYQPFIGTYFIKGTGTTVTLGQSFRGFFEEIPFFLVNFNSWHAAGAMPPEIWTWLNHGQVPPPPPTTPPTLGSGLDIWKPK